MCHAAQGLSLHINSQPTLLASWTMCSRATPSEVTWVWLVGLVRLAQERGLWLALLASQWAACQAANLRMLNPAAAVGDGAPLGCVAMLRQAGVPRQQRPAWAGSHSCC
jgi:hypothetical protein